MAHLNFQVSSWNKQAKTTTRALSYCDDLSVFTFYSVTLSESFQSPSTILYVTFSKPFFLKSSGQKWATRVVLKSLSPEKNTLFLNSNVTLTFYTVILSPQEGNPILPRVKFHRLFLKSKRSFQFVCLFPTLLSNKLRLQFYNAKVERLSLYLFLCFSLFHHFIYWVYSISEFCFWWVLSGRIHFTCEI